MRTPSALNRMAAAAGFCLLVSWGNATAGQVVLGWLEQILIMEAALPLHAKIDTGADNSSVHAEEISYLRRAGGTWVRFVVTDRSGRAATLERPLVRMASIKRKGAAPLERPVVEMTLCLDGKRLTGEVNLADRANFEYRLLLGRSLMAGHFVVDPGRTYLTSPDCH